MEAGEMETPADVHFDDLIWEHIKLGGTPSWYQDVEEPACPVCAKSMSYVAMIPECVEIGFPMTGAEHRAILEQARRTGRRVEMEPREYHDFSFCGCGYVFLCDAECSSEGAVFLWQPD
jgi:hypothetical protein